MDLVTKLQTKAFCGPVLENPQSSKPKLGCVSSLLDSQSVNVSLLIHQETQRKIHV